MYGGLSSDPETFKCGNAERFNTRSEPTNVISDSNTPKLVLFLMANGRLSNRVGSSAGLESEGIISNHAEIPSLLICAQKIRTKESIALVSVLPLTRASRQLELSM